MSPSSDVVVKLRGRISFLEHWGDWQICATCFLIDDFTKAVSANRYSCYLLIPGNQWCSQDTWWRWSGREVLGLNLKVLSKSLSFNITAKKAGNWSPKHPHPYYAPAGICCPIIEWWHQQSSYYLISKQTTLLNRTFQRKFLFSIATIRHKIPRSISACHSRW